MLLAGDIGGTKTALAVFTAQGGLRAPLAEAVYPSADFASFEALLAAFLAEHPLPIERASFGVAGPVVAGRVTGTNMPWNLDRADLVALLKIEAVQLLNDLESIAYAVPRLEPGDLETLNVGERNPQGSIAVIAPGTGLGEAYLTWDGQAYRPYPSEGGHADFAPNTAQETELVAYMMERYGHVSCERVCSGLGIPNIYAFLRAQGEWHESEELAQALANADDPTPTIVNNALSAQPHPLCRATLEVFVDVLAAETGNLALKVFATGGVYLGGGIPPRILSVLRGERFLRAFCHKGRLASILAKMPVHVILNPKAALMGAAWYGLQQS